MASKILAVTGIMDPYQMLIKNLIIQITNTIFGHGFGEGVPTDQVGEFFMNRNYQDKNEDLNG